MRTTSARPTSGALPVRSLCPLPRQNPVLRGLLPSITTPAQIIAGREDDLVPWSNNKYLADLLPNSELHPLDAGHFAWEQASDEIRPSSSSWVWGFQRRWRGDGLRPPMREELVELGLVPRRGAAARAG